jgi:hypothetical protein
MAGAFHGPGEGESTLNVGVSGPGVVKAALEDYRGASFDEIADAIKKTAFKITRMGQLVGQEAARRLAVPFGILDLSLAPTPEVGDSVARILEERALRRRAPTAPPRPWRCSPTWSRRAASWPPPTWEASPAPSYRSPRTKAWSPRSVPGPCPWTSWRP